MRSTSYRSIAIVAGFASALAAAPASAAPPVTAGPLAVAAAQKLSPAVETAAWRGYRHHRHWGGSGAWVAGAALGIIGLALANRSYGGSYYDYGDDSGYGYGGYGYGGYGGYGRHFHGGRGFGHGGFGRFGGGHFAGGGFGRHAFAGGHGGGFGGVRRR